MPSCFIISPIGESGSEIRRNADDLRDLIIKPALEPFGFEVVRGDHRSEAGQIDIDIIRAVQESDLCIVDISLPNPNVYYEFGRRDETGKPLILLKAKGSEDMPVDIATRRYIEYDLDSRRGIIDAVIQLKAFVEPIVKHGFESSGTGTSLSELAEVLKRIERKVDRLGTSAAPAPLPGGTLTSEKGIDPVDMFKLALRQKNIPMAERAMEQLQYRMTRHRWLDQVVEQTAAMGSIKAGDILIKSAYEFMDEAQSFHEKVEYLGYLVTALVRTDRELENLELVEQLCESLRAVSVGEATEDTLDIYNQLNRLYYGIYGETHDRAWLEKSINALKRALEIRDDLSFLYYNLSICERARDQGNDKLMALQHVLRCIELDRDKPDDDHLEMACKLMHELEDPRLSDFLARLEEVNAVKARLLRDQWA